MFFKIQSIKQLMTAAYKGEGLTVGRDAYSETDKVGYYIHGHGWTVWNSEACMPNVLKAAIVEFCGSLPEYGEQILVQKNSSGQQVCFPDPELYLPGKMKSGAVGTWEITPVHIVREHDFILLQSGMGNHRATREIPARYVNMIKPEAIEESQGETTCAGPFRVGVEAIWRTNVCYLCAETYIADVDQKLMLHMNEYQINAEE